MHLPTTIPAATSTTTSVISTSSTTSTTQGSPGDQIAVVEDLGIEDLELEVSLTIYPVERLHDCTVKLLKSGEPKFEGHCVPTPFDPTELWSDSGNPLGAYPLAFGALDWSTAYPYGLAGSYGSMWGYIVVDRTWYGQPQAITEESILGVSATLTMVDISAQVPGRSWNPRWDIGHPGAPAYLCQFEGNLQFGEVPQLVPGP